MATFTRRTRTFDANNRMTEVVTTIDGEGIFVRGLGSTYREIGLIESQAPTLLFTPTTYGLRAFTDEFVKAGDTCDIEGETFTAKDVRPFGPDGIVVSARIVVAR